MDNVLFFSFIFIGCGYGYIMYNSYDFVIGFLGKLYSKLGNLLISNQPDSSSGSPKEDSKKDIKYEDKYLDEIRNINKEFEFTEEEVQLEEVLERRFYNEIKENTQEELDETKGKLSTNSKNSDLSKKFTELNNLINTEKGLNEIKTMAKKKARKTIIDKRIEKLNSSYILEKTPLGNVLMIYDLNRETFKYYSDITIPYRYLETVGRKYVKTFGCRPIFVDMEDELRLCEEKWEKERVEKEINDAKKALLNEPKKKSVFAKFKSYNKDAKSGRVSAAAPPKNNISVRKLTEDQENEKVLLKEQANRYTYEGKLANFSFLKKVERKLVDKKFATSYSEFKKMMHNK